jgi:hypothetical protein
MNGLDLQRKRCRRYVGSPDWRTLVSVDWIPEKQQVLRAKRTILIVTTLPHTDPALRTRVAPSLNQPMRYLQVIANPGHDKIHKVCDCFRLVIKAGH